MVGRVDGELTRQRVRLGVLRPRSVCQHKVKLARELQRGERLGEENRGSAVQGDEQSASNRNSMLRSMRLARQWNNGITVNKVESAHSDYPN